MCWLLYGSFCTDMAIQIQKALMALQVEGRISANDYLVSSVCVCVCVCAMYSLSKILLNVHNFMLFPSLIAVLWERVQTVQCWPVQGLRYSKWWPPHLPATVGFFQAAHLYPFNTPVKFSSPCEVCFCETTHSRTDDYSASKLLICLVNCDHS